MIGTQKADPFTSLDLDELRRWLEQGGSSANDRVDALGLDAIAVMLTRFLSRQIDVERLVEWANILDANEHTEVVQDEAELIAQLLFELASPEINGEINDASATSMLARIRAESRVLGRVSDPPTSQLKD